MKDYIGRRKIITLGLVGLLLIPFIGAVSEEHPGIQVSLHGLSVAPTITKPEGDLIVEFGIKVIPSNRVNLNGVKYLVEILRTEGLGSEHPGIKPLYLNDNPREGKLKIKENQVDDRFTFVFPRYCKEIGPYSKEAHAVKVQVEAIGFATASLQDAPIVLGSKTDIVNFDPFDLKC